MDGSGHYQPAQGPGGMHFYSPAQLPQFPQTPVQGGVPLYPAMNFPVMPVQLATNSLTPAQFPLQPAVGIHPAMMNNMMPGRGLPPPGPSTPTPAKQAIPTFHHGPMAVAQPEVPFDPNTPPPFADRAQMQTPRRNGVLKIANIPYTISIPEMHQFIGRYLPTHHLISAHITGYPTHIIMERSTGKTMDCYMELKSPETAAVDWKRAFGTQQMRIPKIGQRNVEVTVSTQSELMKEVFPRAKCIHWDDGNMGAPTMIPNRDVYSSGFNGFITTEELTCMARHAETPLRSQFAARSMNRAYECMISTLYKFPWFAAKLYTMRLGQEMFKCYKKQLDALISRLTSNTTPREVGLDYKLLMDLIFAGLNTSGFSERQKAEIADTSSVTLSVHPPKLSDQDVAMWLDILNIGVSVMEQQCRPFIGIAPYLEVSRDMDTAHIVFLPTEAGLNLKRAQFAMLETRMMHHIMDHGWNAYLPQMGIEPSSLFDSPDSQLDNSFAANAVANDTGIYTVNEHGQREAAGDNASTSNIDDDLEFIQAGETGVTSDSFNDPEQALSAMRQVVEQVREAPPADQASATATANAGAGTVGGAAGVDIVVEGLGAGLDNLDLNNPGNPAVARYVPPARRTTNHRNLQPAVDLNPESPAFQPPPVFTQQVGIGPSLPAGAAFAGAGLGNGDFTTSPPRISTRRGSSMTSNSTVNQGNGKESALTAPAAAVRLQPAPVLGPAFAPYAGQAQISTAPAFAPSAGQGQVPSGQVLTYGQARGPGAPHVEILQDIAANAAQRRAITIRDHRGNVVEPLRSDAPVAPTAGSVTAGTGNGSAAADTALPLNRPKTRAGNAIPNHGTDGTGRSFDDTLDEWFNEKTDEPTRMAISAGMNMRTASAASLAAPSTPPPKPSPALHRSPARERLHTHYEFDELHMSQAENMPIIPPTFPTRTFGGHASAPATPAPAMLRTPRQTLLRTPGSLQTRGTNTTFQDSTGGVRLPRSVTTGNLFTGTPTPNFGVVGDGSPLRCKNVNTPGATLAGSPLPYRYTYIEGTAEQHAARMAMHRERMLRRRNTDEEEERS